MSVALAFKTSTYLLVLDGLAAVIMGGFVSPTVGALAFLVVAGSWWSERLQSVIARIPTLWRLLVLGGAVFIALDLVYLAESLLDGFVHLLLLLVCYKLCHRRSPQDTRDLLVLAFFMLVAASALTVSMGFLVILIVFLVVGTLTFVLYHLTSEIARYRTALRSASVALTPSLLTMSGAAAGLTLAFTVALFFVIPRIGQAMIPLTGKTGPAVTGFSNHVKLGTFGSIQTDPAVVMRVRFLDGPPDAEALAGLRWRGKAFDYFTGQEWLVKDPDRKPLPRGLAGQFVLAPPRGGRILIQEIYLEPIGTDVLFAAPRLLSVALPAGIAAADALDSVAFSFRNVRLRYVALSEPETPRKPGARGPSFIPDEILDRYLQLPPLPPRVAALAREVTRESRGPYQAALALTAHLRRSLRYSLDLRRETALPPVEEFLFVTRQGNCEYFATSLTVLLRSLGIPARMVTGFQRGEWNPYGQYLLVRQRDAHAWVEAYFAGQGWLTLDPSPRAEFDAAFLTSQFAYYLDALRMRWYRYIVNWSLTDQIAVAAAVRDHALDWRRAALRFGLPADWGTWARWLFGVGAGGGVLFLAARLWRRIGQTGRPRSAPAGRALRAYDRMLRHLARHGLIPEPPETAREFAVRAGRADPGVDLPVREITGAYERVRFGGGTVGAQEEKRLLALAETVCSRPRQGS